MRYSIYSGDPDGIFSINAETGQISTAAVLDHETHPSVLLNVQARSGQPPTFGHSQVRAAARHRQSTPRAETAAHLNHILPRLSYRGLTLRSSPFVIAPSYLWFGYKS